MLHNYCTGWARKTAPVYNSCTVGVVQKYEHSTICFFRVTHTHTLLNIVTKLSPKVVQSVKRDSDYVGHELYKVGRKKTLVYNVLFLLQFASLVDSNSCCLVYFTEIVKKYLSFTI